MNLFEQIKHTEHLTAAERQFAAYLEEHTGAVLQSSLQEVLTNAYVSKSMLLRFCKKLGLSGFKELKLRLAQESSLACH